MMNRLQLVLSILFIVIAARAYAQSHLYPETIVTYNPLTADSRGTENVFLRTMDVWGEFGQYAGLRDDNHRWGIALGGTAELYGGRNWNVLFETNMHLAVDPNNNISFNPRAFFWEEGIFTGYQQGVNSFYLGYAHRCKHDVDNNELYNVTGREESRALIYGSAVFRWLREQYTIGDVALRPLAEAHYYFVLQDQRFPVQTRILRPTLEALQAALRVRLDAEILLSGDVSLHATGDVRITTLGAAPTERLSSVDDVWVEPALEAAVRFHGAAGAMEFFARYMYQEDDMISPVPRSAELLLVGVRLRK